MQSLQVRIPLACSKVVCFGLGVISLTLFFSYSLQTKERLSLCYLGETEPSGVIFEREAVQMTDSENKACEIKNGTDEAENW